MDRDLDDRNLDNGSEIDPTTGLPIGREVVSTPARWPEARVLSGHIVRLEFLNPAQHGDDLWQAVGGVNHAALWLYMSDGPFPERSEFDARLTNAAEQQDPVFYAIVQQRTGIALGWCALLNIRPKYRSVEVGYLLFSAQLQRTPAATETIYLITKYVFDDLGYRRYEWKCNALNAKSIAAAKRFGFVFEGIFRQHMIVKGRNRDSTWFSMTADEWPCVKRAFERWLDTANFDETGRQRRKLSDLLGESSAT